MKRGESRYEPWESRSSRIVEKIAGIGADIVCLQEVQGQAAFDRIAHLLAKKGYHGVYDNRNNGQDEGLATFFKPDKYEVTDRDRVDFTDRTGRFATSTRMRSLTDGREVNVLNTHLIYNPDQQVQQAKEVNEFAKQHLDLPLALCGDYNATPETKIYRELLSGLNDASFRNHPSPTFTLAHPVRIDGILLHQLIPTTTYTVGDVHQTKTSEPSDHLPLVTDLKFTSDYRESLQNVATLFREKNFREAMRQFEQLPQRLQNHTFGNAYRIIQGKVPDQADLGNLAMYGKVSFEDEERAQAIEKTLSDLL